MNKLFLSVLICTPILLNGCAVNKNYLFGKIESYCEKDSGSDVYRQVNIEGFMYSDIAPYITTLDPLLSGGLKYLEYNGEGRTLLSAPPFTYTTRPPGSPIHFKNKNTLNILRFTVKPYNEAGCYEITDADNANLKRNRPDLPTYFPIYIEKGKPVKIQSHRYIGDKCLKIESVEKPKSKYEYVALNSSFLSGSSKTKGKGVSLKKYESLIREIKSKEIIAYHRNYSAKDNDCGLKCFSSGYYGVQCTDKDKYKNRYKPWKHALCYLGEEPGVGHNKKKQPISCRGG